MVQDAAMSPILPPVPRRIHTADAERRNWISRLERSGLDLLSFARRHGLVLISLQLWSGAMGSVPYFLHFIQFSRTRRRYESPRAPGQHAQSTHGHRIPRPPIISGLHLFQFLTKRSAPGSDLPVECLVQGSFGAGT
jgi:hypothetical protein